MKTYYRRNLPHIQPIGFCFFVTARLYGSIPHSVIHSIKDNYLNQLENIDLNKSLHSQNYEKLIIKKQYHEKIESALHDIQDGPHHLKNPSVATMLLKQFHRFDNKFYDLIAYSIMSNHFHLLINFNEQAQAIKDDRDYVQLHQVIKRIKGASASFANKILERSGQFWERESFDMYIRNEKMYRNVISYILNNPVKAGVTNRWDEHPYTYLKVVTE